MELGWKSGNFARNILYIRPEKESNRSSTYASELFMKYSFFGLLTALFSLVILAGCVPPSEEIIEIEKSMSNNVDLEKDAEFLPLSGFESPQDPDGEKSRLDITDF